MIFDDEQLITNGTGSVLRTHKGNRHDIRLVGIVSLSLTLTGRHFPANPA